MLLLLFSVRSRGAPGADPSPSGPTLQIDVTCDSSGNFNIHGIDGDHVVRTTYGGYHTRVRVNGQTSDDSFQCQLNQVGPVAFESGVAPLSNTTAMVAFGLVNLGDATVNADLEVDADILLDEADDAAVQIMDSNRGIIVFSDTYAVTWHLASFPGTEVVQTIWAGPNDDRDSNYWSQSPTKLFSGQDSAFAYSWQNIPLSPGVVVVRRSIVFFGVPGSNDLTLTLTLPSPPLHMHIDETVTFSGYTNATTASPTWIWITIDGLNMLPDEANAGMPSGRPFTVSFALGDAVVTGGLHNFSVFAADSLGSVSTDSRFSIDVSAPTPAQTAIPVASPSPLPTASTSATRPPVRTIPANIPVLDMTVECGVQDNFEVLGRFQDLFTVPLSWTDGGWFTRLRVNQGDLSDTAYGCGPSEIDGVVLTTNFRNISRSATLVSFTLTNTRNLAVTADVVLNAYLLLNWVLDVVVAAIDSGFVVYSSDFAFTLVGRGTPLVSDVSTIWFGQDNQVEDSLWTQTLDKETVNDFSAVAFSWQNISIAPDNATATRTVIMKWGPPVSNRLFLWIGDVPANGTRFELFMRVQSDVLNETVSLWAVVNNSVALIRKIAERLPVNEEVFVPVDKVALGIVGVDYPWKFVAVDSMGTLSVPGTDPKEKESNKGVVIGVSVAAAVVVVAVILGVVVWRRKRNAVPGQSKEQWTQLERRAAV